MVGRIQDNSFVVQWILVPQRSVDTFSQCYLVVTSLLKQTHALISILNTTKFDSRVWLWHSWNRKDIISIYGTISHSWVLCMKIIFLFHCCFQNWLLSTLAQFSSIHLGRKFLMPAFDRNLPVKSSIGTAQEIVTMGLFVPIGPPFCLQRKSRTWISISLTIMLLRLRSLELCVLYAWTNCLVFILEQHERTYEHRQNLEPNRVRSLINA